MAEKKFQFEKFMTPVGIAKYPRLLEPDFGNDKFPKPAGEFSVKLIIPLGTPGLAELTEKLESIRDAEYDKVMETLSKADHKTRAKVAKAGGIKKADVVEMELDEETGEETGNVILKCAMKHTTVRNKGKANESTSTKWPAIFDSQGKEVKNLKIGGGSELRVSGYIMPWYVASSLAVGASLKMMAVQVVKLVEFGKRDAASFGFGAEEGGFTADSDESGDNPFAAADAPATDAGATQGYQF